MNVSLLSTNDDKIIWNENYDTTLDEIIDVQDEIFESTVAKLIG